MQEKYSQAYRYDLNKGKKSSKWTTDFEAMALKTVIVVSVSGNLSVDMQRAGPGRSKTFDGEGDGSYGDNKLMLLPPAQDPFQIEQQEEEEPEDVDIEDM